jgi:adenylylsulfate kinase-like enzyme
MTKKILIMGPNSQEKFYISTQTKFKLEVAGFTCELIQGDEMRTNHSNWDFESEGLDLQARHMKDWADACTSDYAIAAFACATAGQRAIFQADYTVLLDPEQMNHYPYFSVPEKYDFLLDTSESDVDTVVTAIVNGVS